MEDKGMSLNDTLNVHIKNNNIILVNYKNTRRGTLWRTFQNTETGRAVLKELFIWALRKKWKIEWKNDPCPRNTDPEDHDAYITSIYSVHDEAIREEKQHA